MASEMNHRGGHKGPVQSLIRKLTTDKAAKAYRQGQQTKRGQGTDDILNINLCDRGIKNIESIELPALRRLDLSKNNLNRLKGLQGCPKVTYLAVAGNELTGEGLDGVRPLRDLKVLNVSGNRLKRVPPAVFAQFRQLQALVLNNNEIAEVPPTWLKKGLLTLNTLVLSHNKVKSLADTGLGRLTALTKLSVSHNILQDLPDLSACSGLEELRAAHNQISEVPASLAKNVALRTLDLGHNDIEEWRGLERVGKACSSLVQLSLSGNPLCATATAADNEDGDADGDGGVYVAKLKSFFPGLKVRDGKRILMKKSHMYCEERETVVDKESGAHHNAGLESASAGVGNRGGTGEMKADRNSGKPRKNKVHKGSKDEVMVMAEKFTRAGDGDGERDEAMVYKAKSGNMEERTKEKKRKKEGMSEAGLDEKPTAESSSAELDSEAKKKSKKRRRGDERTASSRSVPTTDGSFETEDESSHHDEAPDAAEKRSRGALMTAKKPTTLKAKKVERKGIPSGASGAKSAVKTTKKIVDNDPYSSSSEELPVRKAQEQGARDKQARGGAITSGNTTANVVDLESGVVAVVVNPKKHRSKRGNEKEKRARGFRVSSSSRAKHHDDDVPSKASVGVEGDLVGRFKDEEGCGFSVEKMLKARETVGMGMIAGGVSAWD